jgi:hypothetical protein
MNNIKSLTIDTATLNPEGNLLTVNFTDDGGVYYPVTYHLQKYANGEWVNDVDQEAKTKQLVKDELGVDFDGDLSGLIGQSHDVYDYGKFFSLHEVEAFKPVDKWAANEVGIHQLTNGSIHDAGFAFFIEGDEGELRRSIKLNYSEFDNETRKSHPLANKLAQRKAELTQLFSADFLQAKGFDFTANVISRAIGGNNVVWAELVPNSVKLADDTIADKDLPF